MCFPSLSPSPSSGQGKMMVDNATVRAAVARARFLLQSSAGHIGEIGDAGSRAMKPSSLRSPLGSRDGRHLCELRVLLVEQL